MSSTGSPSTASVPVAAFLMKIAGCDVCTTLWFGVTIPSLLIMMLPGPVGSCCWDLLSKPQHVSSVLLDKTTL